MHRYTEEQKREALDLAAKIGLGKAAAKLGINQVSISRWKREDLKTADKSVLSENLRDPDALNAFPNPRLTLLNDIPTYYSTEESLKILAEENRSLRAEVEKLSYELDALSIRVGKLTSSLIALTK